MMRRQKFSIFLLILVILAFVNFLIHGGDQHGYSSKYLKQHKIFKSSICAVSAIFGSINKFVFIADPIFANLTDLKTLSEKREVTIGIFANPEEFTDDVLQNLQDTYFYINISSVMCSGTNTIGALIIDDGRQLIYIHIFESTGDYYRICSIELPERFPFGDVDRSMDIFSVGITEINNECKMLIYEDINQYLFNYQSSKLIECNRTSMEWVLANYPELIADETIVQQRIKPGILSLKSKGNALRKRFFISDGTLLGWYRQCGIILQSKDVDFSMLWTEYDKQIHNTFLGNKDLYLFTEYGLDPGRKELRLRSDEYTFDLFVLKYNETIKKLVGLYQEAKNNYRCLYPPINEICSTDLVGLRVLVPCNALDIIEYEYGSYPLWQIPRIDGGHWSNVEFVEVFNESYLNCVYKKEFNQNGEEIKGHYQVNSSNVECKK